MYRRVELLALYSPALRPDVATLNQLRDSSLLSTVRLQLHYRGRYVCLKSYRGCRAGLSHRRAVLRSAGNGAFVVTSTRSAIATKKKAQIAPVPARSLTAVVRSTEKKLIFGCFNVRSLHNKIDDIMQLRQDRSLQVLCIVES